MPTKLEQPSPSEEECRKKRVALKKVGLPERVIQFKMKTYKETKTILIKKNWQLPLTVLTKDLHHLKRLSRPMNCS